MTLAPGTKVGPYEILSPVGAGGMGEVYRARDTKLDRDVAIKVLPAEFVDDAERLARFRREAQILASLNHPNIAAIHGLEESAGLVALAMEFVPGGDLAQILRNGPFPADEALRVGKQIAEALEEAHEKGIVHRDLKPANVKLTPDGRVKLLDFGLARAYESDGGTGNGSSPSATRSPTLTGRGTAAGLILGTAAYMSPEQARGKPVDKRTDVWAFGCVLFEMLTGKRAFEGETISDTLAAVLRGDPDWAALEAAGAPSAVAGVLRRCLTRESRQRLRDIGDARITLEETLATQGSGPGTPAARPDSRAGDDGGGAFAGSAAAGRSAAGTPPPRRRLAALIAPWGLAACLAAAAAVMALRREAPGELARFPIAPPPGEHYGDTIALSPDGRSAAFLLGHEGGRASIWVRTLDEIGAKPLEGTREARYPFWSPDGREIAFFSEGKLRRISAGGGAVRTVCDVGGGLGGTWSPDGTILFPPDFGAAIVAVAASGGVPRKVTALDESRGDAAHLFPAFLPDGRHFVFVARNRDPEKTQILLASLDSKEVRPLFHSDSAAVYSEPGYLVFARDGALLAWKFDASALRLAAEPLPLFDNVRYGTEDNRIPLAATRDKLGYLSWSQRRKLVWVDRKGTELATLGPVGGYEDVRISPDGRRVAVSQRDRANGQNLDVWVLDAERGTSTRITSERTDEFNPAWFPDGERLAYVSDHQGFYDLFERPSTGGAEKTLVRSSQDKTLPSITADGRQLLFSVSEGSRTHRMLLALGGSREPTRLGAVSRFSEEYAEISPDGRYAAFESDEPGEREIYVEPLPSGPKIQVSVKGGEGPVWRRDGSELFFRSRAGMMMSVAVRDQGGRFEAAAPRPLFSLQVDEPGSHNVRHVFDVSPDGERFLLIRRAEGGTDDLVIALNWTSVLKRAR